MRYRIVPVTPLQQNCTIAVCAATNRAAIVDPGGDLDRIVAALEAMGATAEKILLTHGHIDHVAGTVALSERLGIPVEGPERADDFWIRTLPAQAHTFGFPPTPSFEPGRWLVDGDPVSVGEEAFRVLHCPGHTPGHVVFFHEGDRLALVGDVLFQGSIGRTDFPKGDYDALMSSIKDKLLPLGDDVTFIPGHGPRSTFGAERRSNPFLR
jgi:hydroxyacylglutathione hydrolase